MALAAVIGVGMIPFGKYPERTIVDMASEAVFQAFKDAGIRPAQVDACFFASGFAARLSGDGVGPDGLIRWLGMVEGRT